MKRHVLLFDLQFLKFTHLHTPYPSTAGLLLAGYHKGQGDRVMLSTVIPNFAMYDIIYIIKDDWDLYHDPSWLRHSNVVPVGRFWTEGIRVWDEEWENYPPDPTPYRTWVNAWLKKYPALKLTRFKPFFHEPVLIKNNKRILNPDNDEVLVIDYEPHNIDADFHTLKGLNVKSLKFLHPVDITKDPSGVFELMAQRNVQDNKWATMDVDISQSELTELIDTWNEYRPGRTVRLKVWIQGNDNESWFNELYKIMPFLERWRNEAGKRIYVEPVDELTFDYPEVLYFLRRWTGRDMGYAYNSLLDYCIYDSLQNNHRIEELFRDPEGVLARAKPHNGVETKLMKVGKILQFINDYPDIAELISKPVIRKGV